ncbi:MAG: glutathione S-transferase family protein [Pseudanabaenaceae cyanobacterium]
MPVALSWAELTALDTYTGDSEEARVNGPTNAQAQCRLFGADPAAVRVTLYRDRHAWCPYCQKVWLWLEEKRIPYRIEKVTMFCYGEKEAWYKRKVPSGMLPALELDGQLITESDRILESLERAFGPLHRGMGEVVPLRQLERQLFRAWCTWLCHPHSAAADRQAQQQFETVAAAVAAALAATPGPYFLSEFSTADVVFTPYVERMNASLFYYKGYLLREAAPQWRDWFAALETRPTYRGTQSDFHTHVHDLPPQMGGCWANTAPETARNQAQVDRGPWFGLPDVVAPEPATVRVEALHRVLRHRVTLNKVNPVGGETFDEALRCALTYLMTGELLTPPPHSDVALRYMRDRISVPRDMSIYAAKHLRTALEATAAQAGDRPGPAIPVQHRYDQNPKPFVESILH